MELTFPPIKEGRGSSPTGEQEREGWGMAGQMWGLVVGNMGTRSGQRGDS